MLKILTRTQYHYKNYGKLSFNPFESQPPPQNPQELNKIVQSVHKWASSHGAQYYSFLAYPHSQGLAQKQQTFLNCKFEVKNLITNIVKEKFTLSNIIKNEGDGSSFPNGGLRHTSHARSYLVWDWKSDLYIRKSNKVLYIPALLINHFGQALDEKTLFRKAQEKLQKECLSFLKSLGKEPNKIMIGMGLEQQFFIIPKKQYYQRIDLKQTGRALIGRMPPHNQQCSDHYYGKIEGIVERILEESQRELLQMGVPIKTRHKEVAPNQFELCSTFEEAGKTIDHNLLKVDVLRQVCDRHDYTFLIHEKPFSDINGSGKHINWSLNYCEGKSQIYNLFSPESSSNELFLLFTLIKLKAVLNNQRLYLASVCVPGNELRLGGHQAPPRIISTFMGQHVTSMIQRLPEKPRQNLREKIHNLVTKIHQEDTDRNRTSPYAYTSNRFEFRAVGSSQNCLFPTTVILTTIAKEIEEAHKLLKSGLSVQQIIQKLTEQTTAIRFEGDGYAPQWIDEAKKRNLYVNTDFVENIENIKNHGKILVETGVYSESQLAAKYNISKQAYINVVKKEVETLLIILNKNIIPRALQFLKNAPENPSSHVSNRIKKFQSHLDRLLVEVERLEKESAKGDISLQQAEKIRAMVNQMDGLTNNVTDFLPESKDWPELYDVLGKY